MSQYQNDEDPIGPVELSPKLKRFFWTIGLIIFLVVGVTFGAPKVAPMITGMLNQPAQPSNIATPVSAPATQPAINPTAIGNISPTFTALPNGQKPVVNICIIAFGSYFKITQMDTLNNPAYTANIILLQFSDANDNPVTEGTEVQQIEWMKAGQMCDMLATTSDTVAANVTMGKIIAIIDRSDGADFVRWWNVGKTGSIAGKNIEFINDLKGGKIAAAENSVSYYQALSWILAMGYTTQDIEIVTYPTIELALAAFERGETDAYAGWLDTDKQAVLDESTLGASTEGLHTIYDVLVVNLKADAEKKPLIIEALADYFRTAKMEVENFDEMASAIARWQFKYEGQSYPINSWAEISEEFAADDLQYWNETISEASFDHNLTFGKNPNLVYDILKLNRKVLELGDEPLESPFIPENLYDPSYILALESRDGLRPVTGTFVNTNFSPFPATASDAPDVNKLLKLPTFIEFNCPSVFFGGGKSEIDLRSDMGKQFKECGENYRLILNQSPNGVLLITGSAARPDPAVFGQQYTFEYSDNLAHNRAIWAQTTLINLGIPGNRIAINWTVGEITRDQKVMHESRFVTIELKLDDSLR